MTSVKNRVGNILNISKHIPVIKTLQFSLYEHYWRHKTAMDWKRRYAAAEFVVDRQNQPEPTLGNLTSQLCTASQCMDRRYRQWCREMRSPARLARKQWEFVFALEALSRHGMLVEGKTGLGFGCGGEPLSSIFAKHGCQIVATDLATGEAEEKGWVATNEHASSLAALNSYGICPRKTFASNVRFEFADMNDIPEKYHHEFDFVWSSCAFEHLGSIRNGLDFVINAMSCLKPGGIAVHTTEFNLSSDQDTYEGSNCVIFRKSDIERLQKELAQLGCTLAPLNLNPGTQPVDHHIDLPPYAATPHLKLKLNEFVTTSIGLIITKGRGENQSL